MNRLAHKVALVTSSSSGIGRAMALRFGEEGATVVVWPDGWRSVSRSWRVKRVCERCTTSGTGGTGQIGKSIVSGMRQRVTSGIRHSENFEPSPVSPFSPVSRGYPACPQSFPQPVRSSGNSWYIVRSTCSAWFAI